jgi:flagellin-like hook-associated protein FlgL
MSMSVSTNTSALRAGAYLVSNSHADADLGKESSNLAKQLMLSQMSASVLAQANASTNTSLILLS